MVHEPENNRFVLRRDGVELGFTEYDRPHGGYRFLHTEIDPAIQERGLGTILVQGALDWLRENSDARVSATCPFTRAFLRRHPEYHDLTERSAD